MRLVLILLLAGLHSQLVASQTVTLLWTDGIDLTTAAVAIAEGDTDACLAASIPAAATYDITITCKADVTSAGVACPIIDYNNDGTFTVIITAGQTTGVTCATIVLDNVLEGAPKNLQLQSNGCSAFPASVTVTDYTDANVIAADTVGDPIDVNFGSSTYTFVEQAAPVFAFSFYTTATVGGNVIPFPLWTSQTLTFVAGVTSITGIVGSDTAEEVTDFVASTVSLVLDGGTIPCKTTWAVGEVTDTTGLVINDDTIKEALEYYTAVLFTTDIEIQTTSSATILIVDKDHDEEYVCTDTSGIRRTAKTDVDGYFISTATSPSTTFKQIDGKPCRNCHKLAEYGDTLNNDYTVLPYRFSKPNKRLRNRLSAYKWDGKDSSIYTFVIPESKQMVTMGRRTRYLFPDSTNANLLDTTQGGDLIIGVLPVSRPVLTRELRWTKDGIEMRKLKKKKVPTATLR